MNTGYEFSMDRVRRCSGNAQDDLPYLRWFCDQALIKGKIAANELKKLRDLCGWDDGDPYVRAYVAWGTLQGVLASLIEMETFFCKKPEISCLFSDARDSLQSVYESSKTNAGVVFAWLLPPR